MTTSGVLSIGVGNHLCRETGLSVDQLSVVIGSVAEYTPDGGVSVMAISGVSAYILRREKEIDAGTRDDFEQLAGKGSANCQNWR